MIIEQLTKSLAAVTATASKYPMAKNVPPVELLFRLRRIPFFEREIAFMMIRKAMWMNCDIR